MGYTLYDLSQTDASNTSFAGISQAENSMTPGSVNNAFRAHDGAMARYIADEWAVNTVGGTGDVITVTAAQGWTAYATGQGLRFIASAANTTNVTLNVNGIGAKAVRKISGGTDVALVANDLVAGETYTVIYRASANSAAGAWVLVGGSFLPLTGGTLTGNLTVSKASPVFALNKAASGQETLIYGKTNGVNRWAIDVGDFISESGANAGSNLAVFNYDDSGASINTPLYIYRSSGATALRSLFTPNATGGDKGADTINATTYYKNGNYGVVTLGTPTASTSGTAVGFTGIPSGVRRVTMSLKAVSTNGTSVPIIQIGSGSYTTSGYVAYGNNLAAASANFSGAAFTNGIPLGSGSIGAADSYYGLYVFQLENASTNSWVAFGGVSGNGALVGFGGVSLGGALDRIQLTTSGGTAAFDAGEINITYE